MCYKLLTIIILIILVGIFSYRCSNDCNFWGDACNADAIYFQDSYGSFQTVNGSEKKLGGFSVHINTDCAAELSNVFIEVVLPKEVTILSLHPQQNEHVDYANRRVTRKVDKILQVSSASTGIGVKYDTAEWSKPIEVFISADYKQKVVCKYEWQGRKNGRYTKKTYFIVNEKGTLDEMPNSDKMWTYVGPS